MGDRLKDIRNRDRQRPPSDSYLLRERYLSVARNDRSLLLEEVASRQNEIRRLEKLLNAEKRNIAEMHEHVAKKEAKLAVQNKSLYSLRSQLSFLKKKKGELPNGKSS